MSGGYLYHEVTRLYVHIEFIDCHLPRHVDVGHVICVVCLSHRLVQPLLWVRVTSDLIGVVPHEVLVVVVGGLVVSIRRWIAGLAGCG